ncbi:ubiquitin-like protein Pup [Actinomyces weissii]|uniref:Prokaryotic ubiquitin-like protein Pup n=1 Tax=Actinomyces weissii TaxID=675090 RepID=A0A7T7M8F9_9ACTO|nr:ubiquitin-like protein Pup [Actinomyces weissii]QQM66604.1 ubiquitin-like protein Pup [Actinomyces weissii]
MSQSQAQTQPGGGEHLPDGVEALSGRMQASGVDSILDEIDLVLETNAAAFVQGFVQKGGQ